MEARTNHPIERRALQVTCRFRAPDRLQVGVFDRSLRDALHTETGIDTPWPEVRRVAEQFALYLRGQDRRFVECEVVYNRLYASHRQALQIHQWELQRAQQRIVDTQRMANVGWNMGFAQQYLNTASQKEQAQARALELLQKLSPEIATLAQKGGAFYITSNTGERFILDPKQRIVMWLGAERPVSLCIYIRKDDVQNNIYDWTITMWKWIQTDCASFLEVANHFNTARQLSDHKDFEIVPRAAAQPQQYGWQANPVARPQPLQGHVADMIVFDEVGGLDAAIFGPGHELE